MNIFALDLGTHCGWARTQGGLYLHGTVDLSGSRHEGGGARFLRWNAWTDRYVLTGDVDLVVYEEIRRHLGTDAAHVYGGLLAVLSSKLEVVGIPYIGVPVGTIKKHATGKGNANKEAMVAAVARYEGKLVGSPLHRVRDHRGRETSAVEHDAADALHLLDYAVKHMGPRT